MVRFFFCGNFYKRGQFRATKNAREGRLVFPSLLFREQFSKNKDSQNGKDDKGKKADDRSCSVHFHKAPPKKNSYLAFIVKIGGVLVKRILRLHSNPVFKEGVAHVIHFIQNIYGVFSRRVDGVSKVGEF